jgi:ABC-type spermidine/putrescine transport system permease subunit II
MNRAFLIILVPAIAVGAFYWAVTAHLGLPLKLTRLFLAGGGFLVAVTVVYVYRRRKARAGGH